MPSASPRRGREMASRSQARAKSPATAAAGQRKDAAASTPRGRSPARRTAPPAALEAWKLRALRLVAAVVVCDYIGVSMMRVTLPFYAQALGGKVIISIWVESA